MVERKPRLYLVTPAIADAAGFAASLEAALAVADVACVLLRVAPGDRAEAGRIARALASLAQDRRAACLVEDLQIARDADADGVHLARWGEELTAALASLKPDRIVGCGGIASRDEAMRAGEAGVDYVMFGDAGDQRALAEIREDVAWWAEIFNVPCVAHARRLDEIAAFANAGADFIAVGDAIWNDPRGVAAAMGDAVRALVGIRAAIA